MLVMELVSQADLTQRYKTFSGLAWMGFRPKASNNPFMAARGGIAKNLPLPSLVLSSKTHHWKGHALSISRSFHKLTGRQPIQKCNKTSDFHTLFRQHVGSSRLWRARSPQTCIWAWWARSLCGCPNSPAALRSVWAPREVRLPRPLWESSRLWSLRPLCKALSTTTRSRSLWRWLLSTTPWLWLRSTASTLSTTRLSTPRLGLDGLLWYFADVLRVVCRDIVLISCICPRRSPSIDFHLRFPVSGAFLGTLAMQVTRPHRTTMATIRHRICRHMTLSPLEGRPEGGAGNHNSKFPSILPKKRCFL